VPDANLLRVLRSDILAILRSSAHERWIAEQLPEWNTRPLMQSHSKPKPTKRDKPKKPAGQMAPKRPTFPLVRVSRSDISLIKTTGKPGPKV